MVVCLPRYGRAPAQQSADIHIWACQEAALHVRERGIFNTGQLMAIAKRELAENMQRIFNFYVEDVSPRDRKHYVLERQEALL
jgi:hypothetical protein